jgi:hypothetical protein
MLSRALRHGSGRTDGRIGDGKRKQTQRDVYFLFPFSVRVELVETIFIPDPLKSPSTGLRANGLGMRRRRDFI